MEEMDNYSEGIQDLDDDKNDYNLLSDKQPQQKAVKIDEKGQEETEINDAGPKKKKKKAKIRFRDIVDLMKRRESQYSQYDEETSNVLNMLRVHFGDPFSRCLGEKNTVRKVPIKMILLLIKLILVTAQLIMFGSERAEFVEYLKGNNIAMKNLLFKDWDPEYEAFPYPPGIGPYAVYTIDDLHEHIDYAVNRYYKLPGTAVGSFFLGHLEDSDHSNKKEICIKYYKEGHFHRNGTIDLDPTIINKCKILTSNFTTYGFDPTIRQLMTSVNGSLVRLLGVELKFTVTSIRIDMEEPATRSQCFRVAGMITFDNVKLNGQIKQDLKTWIDSFQCAGFIENKFIEDDIAVAVMLLVATMLSLLLSVRSFYFSIKTLKVTTDYFRRRHPVIDGKAVEELSAEGKWEIVKARDILIIISDVCTIAGTGFKMVINSQALSSSSNMYDACGILLGSGCLFVWFGVLHYLSYDSRLNLLFRVMAKASGQVMRFLFCFVILFIGFTLCGWVVLGPYHMKFFRIWEAFFCLYSILDGDELYLNYVTVEDDKQIVWWFNSIFITLFHLVFAVIAMNIFIAIFTSTYEVMQEKDERSDLKKWLDNYRHKKKFNLTKKCKTCFCGCLL
ncbi:mucolipin-3-like isoform X2 [Mytilus trossulus]|uniref:mucolipin-3-like isoform X2 n=1 Tax=Mytilus trossulus TaxID=6551 RepID=UPI0030059E6E